MKITGIVLAGGKSSRMGEDKALVNFEGKRLIEWSLATLDTLCDSIIISTNNQNLSAYCHQIIPDEQKNLGPIGGLFTALKNSKTEHNIVIACDTPFVSSQIYRRLKKYAKNYDAVIAGFENKKVEPLVGFYHKAITPILQQQIERQNYKLGAALKLANTRIEIFKNQNLFKNMNTPRDLLER